jgi:hypothetical protein
MSNDFSRLAASILLALAWTALAFVTGQRLEAAKGRAEVATLQAQYSNQLAALQRTLIVASEQLTTTLAQRDAAHRKEISDVQEDAQQRAAALMSGRLRVSVPVANCTPAPAATGAPADDDRQARAELAPETAAALDRIVSDGDSAILDLNACIDRYNDVRDAIRQLNEEVSDAQTP